MNPMDAIEAVFFDFDGVLVESADIKTEAFRALYRPHGPDVVERVLAHHRAHEGISRVEKIRHCHREYLGRTLNADELAAVCAAYGAMVKDAVVACDAVAGSDEFLRAGRGRVKMFVVSGTPEDELLEIVEMRRIGGYFDAVHGSPRRKEPIVEDLLRAHGIARDDAIFIGDAMTDWRAADATGLDFIGRVGTGRVNPFPEGTRIIADLTELVP